MDKQTEKIIKNIAEIQIESLQRIFNNESKPNASLSQELTMKLLEISEEALCNNTPANKLGKVLKDLIKTETQNRIDLYKQVLDIPTVIRTFNEYQLYLCIHILWKMEDVWILDNQEGVLGAWKELQKCIDKFHPEVTLIMN